MSTLQELDNKIVTEWTRAFQEMRRLRFNVEQSMTGASSVIKEDYGIVHPEMSNVEKA